MKIRVLDPLIANQIAAGEVIERPASIVKECLENSLDAGATRIQIDIEHGGMQSIRITDDGQGIAKDDLTTAVVRHGTSKIYDVEDLNAIASLGFRGEALASICAVSKLELTSAVSGSEHAWQLTASGTDASLTEQPVAHPVGTTIITRDLFFNIPARRRFLRTEKTEFIKIEEVVKRIALSRFNVAIKLTHNQRQIYNLPAATTEVMQNKRISQICGKDFIEAALKIDLQATGLRLWGWLAQPEFHRAHADMQFMYINGRMVRDKLVNHAIKQAFEGKLPSDYFAAYVLFLECDPETVDVNVHPTKHEVRFHESRLIHDFVFTSLQKALSNSPEQESLESNTELSFENAFDNSQAAVSYDSMGYTNERPSKVEVAEQQAGYAALQTEESAEVATVGLTLGQPMGVIANQYLLTEGNNSLGLLNLQKAKTIEFSKALGKNIINSKPLLFPLTIALTEKSIQNLTVAFPELKVMGFDIEILGPQQMVLRQVPSFLESVELPQLFTELAAMELLDLTSALAKTAARHLRPFENKIEQEKLLRKIQQTFTDSEQAHCFKFLTMRELERLI